MVAKHLNSELACHKKEAHQAVVSHHPGSKQAAVGHTAGHLKVGNVEVKVKEKQVRAKPPYMFFRDDFIANQRRCGIPVNPATKTFWKDLKDAFQKLNSDSKAYYDSLAAQSDLEARQKREQAKVSHDDSGSASSPRSTQVALCDSGVPAMNPWIVNAGQLDGDITWDTLASEITASCSSILSSASPSSSILGDDVQQVSPLSENFLEKTWRQQLADGVTWADSLAQFDREAQQFAEPDPQGPVFPKQVFYQGHCGCFCRTNNAPDHVRFFVRMTEAFTSLAKKLGPIGTVAKQPILLQFTVAYTNGVECTLYAWLVAPAATSGVHRARQTFVLCERNGDILTLTTMASFTSTRKFAKTATGLVGELRQMDSHSFAEYLMFLQLGCISEGHPEKLCIRRLRFEDSTLSTVLIVGFDPAFEPIILKMADDVELDQDDILLDREAEQENLPLQDDPDDDCHPESEPAADLLSLICGDDDSQKKKKPRTARTGFKKKAEIQARIAMESSRNYSSIYLLEEQPTEPSSSSHQHLASVVRDDAVLSSLDNEDMFGLSEAVRQCEGHHAGVVDGSCTFDLEVDQDACHETVDGFFSANDPQPNGDGDDANADAHTSDLSAPRETSEASQPSRPPSSSSGSQDVLLRKKDGKSLKVTHFKEPKFGNLLCELREYHEPNNISTLVGKVNLMLSKDRTSYKATCSLHSGCQCWVSRTSGNVMDRLVDWLAAGPDINSKEHAKLSKELRESMGVKVRS